LQPALKRHQQQKRPDYIQKKARKEFEADGVIIESDLKRRRSLDIEPLEKDAPGVAKLPQLPDDLKRKQVCDSKGEGAAVLKLLCMEIDDAWLDLRSWVPDHCSTFM